MSFWVYYPEGGKYRFYENGVEVNEKDVSQEILKKASDHSLPKLVEGRTIKKVLLSLKPDLTNIECDLTKLFKEMKVISENKVTNEVKYQANLNPLILSKHTPDNEKVFVTVGATPYDVFISKYISSYLEDEKRSPNIIPFIASVRCSQLGNKTILINRSPPGEYLGVALAGVGVEDFKEIIFQITYTLRELSLIGVRHNSLTPNNIWVEIHPPKTRVYFISKSRYVVIKSKYTPRVMNWGLASLDIESLRNPFLEGECKRNGRCGNANPYFDIHTLALHICYSIKYQNPETFRVAIDFAVLVCKDPFYLTRDCCNTFGLMCRTSGRGGCDTDYVPVGKIRDFNGIVEQHFFDEIIREIPNFDLNFLKNSNNIFVSQKVSSSATEFILYLSNLSKTGKLRSIDFNIAKSRPKEIEPGSTFNIEIFEGVMRPILSAFGDYGVPIIDPKTAYSELIKAMDDETISYISKYRLYLIKTLPYEKLVEILKYDKKKYGLPDRITKGLEEISIKLFPPPTPPKKLLPLDDAIVYAAKNALSAGFSKPVTSFESSLIGRFDNDFYGRNLEWMLTNIYNLSESEINRMYHTNQSLYIIACNHRKHLVGMQLLYLILKGRLVLAERHLSNIKDRSDGHIQFLYKVYDVLKTLKESPKYSERVCSKLFSSDLSMAKNIEAITSDFEKMNLNT